MVVVPSFAAGHDRDPHIVPAVIAGIVILIAEQMRERVHAPADVPDDDGTDSDAPQPDAGCELHGLDRRIAKRKRDQKPGGEIQHRLRERHPDDITLDEAIESVAQDVARITLVADLAAEVGVLQEQPADMRPEQIDQRSVRVGAFVRTMMMHAMRRDPARRRILQAPDREQRQHMLEPERAFEAAMREQAMVAEVHAESAVDIDADDGEHHTGFAVEPGSEREQRQPMEGADRRDIAPIDQPLADAERKRKRRRLLRNQACNGGTDFLLQLSPAFTTSLLHTPRSTARLKLWKYRQNTGL